ncbi:metallophosphoesterase [Paucibacter sp. B2R-40]|uniref:metallophosphoesterase family protein n=1 Tax=Paucibacter sp. B2R-40 TaxID=2893554 RepID=UPI0021E39B61|nr:metallophosphoesterase [Paucibacter sp. B2R-40]MCV2353384.1 metallophosphoesterase [Paucibacter sp. B2R-40]
MFTLISRKFGRHALACTASAALLGALALSATPASAAEADPVVLSFATLGDSRQDPLTSDPTLGALSGQDKTWLQSSKAFSRILRSIQAQKSNLLFFNGDMIHGYGWAGFGYTSNLGGTAISAPVAPTTVGDILNSDLVKFYTQYAFWRGMVAPVMETGTYVVPVPGNHETQCKACGKKAKVENENAWRANMGDLIIDSARFKAVVGQDASNLNVGNNGAFDGLSTDQSQLSYSFDVGDAHFAVVNTDPVGADSKAPAAWLASDFATAKARGAKHFFAFGHKAAYTYNYSATNTPTPAGGLDVNVAARDAFWKVIEDNGATYFCGHEHIFNMQQPKGAAWQILVGAGGSPFDSKFGDASANPATDRTYSWANVLIRKSGKVEITAYGFNDAFGPTQVLKQVTLAR